MSARRTTSLAQTVGFSDREPVGSIEARYRAPIDNPVLEAANPMRRPEPSPIAPGQESVWAYPRPPALEAVAERLRVVFDGETIADTTRGWRILETSHPPTYYLPSRDIRPGSLVPGGRGSFCEWKGGAVYYDVVGRHRTAARAAWSYPDPTPSFAPIVDHVAFYVGAMDASYVGDERATPQPGGFYGGWVTSGIVGPFKGEPGTEGW